MFMIPFAQVAAQQPPALLQFLPLIVLFGLFYVMLIRPQQKQQREHQALLAAIKKHDRVVTSGGLHGTVMNIKDDLVTLRVDDNVKVDIDRSAITRVAEPSDA